MGYKKIFFLFLAFYIFTCIAKVGTPKELQQLNISSKKTIKHNTSLAFDSSKNLVQNLYSGWIDTFTIDKQKFRLLYDSTGKNYENYAIEQFKNHRWIKLFSLYLCSDEYGKFDINNDGYIDFVKFYHARYYTYFYNPILKTLTNTVSIMSEDFEILDSSKFLLINHYDAMYGNTFESSQLYTYKNRKVVFLYTLLKIETGIAGDNEKINLYKLNSKDYDDTTFVKTIKTGKDLNFNYKKIWKSNYKKLLNFK